MAGYSKKIKTVAQIKEGAQWRSPTTRPTLVARFYCCKKEANYSERGKRVTTYRAGYNQNPRHLQIMELEGAQLPRVLMIPKLMWRLSAPLTFSRPGFSGARQRIY